MGVVSLYGLSDFSLRSLSALAGTLTVPVAYLAGREVASRRAARRPAAGVRPAPALAVDRDPGPRQPPARDAEAVRRRQHLSRGSEPEPWTVRYGQRVPAGATELTKPGSELQIAYGAVGDDEAVAVDWPATTGGKFA
ncbi:MAG: hypothetical protein EXQ70_06700 [Solirubrobacterales bacterium]|nr:hypothetical protein [Solirubrobacterales bacterium]